MPQMKGIATAKVNKIVKSQTISTATSKTRKTSINFTQHLTESQKQKKTQVVITSTPKVTSMEPSQLIGLGPKKPKIRKNNSINKTSSISKTINIMAPTRTSRPPTIATQVLINLTLRNNRNSSIDSSETTLTLVKLKITGPTSRKTDTRLKRMLKGVQKDLLSLASTHQKRIQRFTLKTEATHKKI
jgi:hypothetical protein